MKDIELPNFLNYMNNCNKEHICLELTKAACVLKANNQNLSWEQAIKEVIEACISVDFELRKQSANLHNNEQ